MKEQDNRVRVTKILIRHAFLQLLKEKPLQSITVRELCQSAGINRGTFYTHYRDIYDLMHQIEEEMTQEFHAKMMPLLSGSNNVDLVDMITEIFSLIQNNAELLQQPRLSPAQRQDCLAAILQSTRRLSSLITNMLKLNKLEKQVIQPLPQSYDVCAQLCECALQFEDQWEKKQIDFAADLEDRCTLTADTGLLELVWTNLLSNAVKFTPAGGRMRLVERSDRDSLTVTVSDTGCGMDRATQERIFDKFYQGDTSHATEGNGLGLALVRRILELSDGTVTVQSTPGQGSTFTVRLPRDILREETQP